MNNQEKNAPLLMLGPGGDYRTRYDPPPIPHELGLWIACRNAAVWIIAVLIGLVFWGLVFWGVLVFF